MTFYSMMAKIAPDGYGKVYFPCQRTVSVRKSSDLKQSHNVILIFVALASNLVTSCALDTISQRTESESSLPKPRHLQSLSVFSWCPAMRNIEHKIDIAAKPEDVWKIVMDFEKYPEWNPMVIKLSGDAVVGQHLNANIKVGERDPIIVKPLVLKVANNKEFRWVGTWVANWIVRGEHYFRIEETSTGCTFYHGEDFTGLCVGIVFMMIGDGLDKAYAAYNEALKQRTESITPQ